jgi:hypothetical protein
MAYIAMTSFCICNTRRTYEKIIFQITDYRIELRCSICKGLIRWWDDDEPDRTRKVMPFKRTWSYEERLDMR